MGNFQGSVLGALLTLLGWDGSAFRNVKVDSSGHLQVDVLANVLGGDQATETTLALVKAQIGALTTPASGSTNKLLTDALTSLQLIDDLRGALDSVNTDEIVVNVDASVLPTGAATETSLQGIEDQIPDQLIGYVDTVRLKVSDTNAAAGANSLQVSAVPAGKLYVITAITGANLNSATTFSRLSIAGVDSSVAITRDGALLSGYGTVFNGRIILKEDEFIIYNVEGCTLNDNIFLQVAGWEVTAP